jgi:Flp pilus assembly pilin Flp
MFRLYVHLEDWLSSRLASVVSPKRSTLGRRSRTGEAGQTTAEYALVILAAAAVAIVLITWARSSGKLPAFFDKVIDNLISSF